MKWADFWKKIKIGHFWPKTVRNFIYWAISREDHGVSISANHKTAIMRRSKLDFLICVSRPGRHFITGWTHFIPNYCGSNHFISSFSPKELTYSRILRKNQKLYSDNECLNLISENTLTFSLLLRCGSLASLISLRKTCSKNACWC